MNKTLKTIGIVLAVLGVIAGIVCHGSALDDARDL